jgi:hypothetical protein
LAKPGFSIEPDSATPKYRSGLHIAHSSMASSYKLMMAGVLVLIVFGAGMAYYGYDSAIYPVDSALGYLNRAETAQTPEELASYVVKAQRELPAAGNPVWSFPTARTDFGLIQKELNSILSRANSISSLEQYSTEYNTGMTDMHLSLKAMQEDLIEANALPLRQLYQHHVQHDMDCDNTWPVCNHEKGQGKVPRRVREPIAFICTCEDASNCGRQNSRREACQQGQAVF